MAEVAQAYVSLLFSARGADRNIERAIGGGADRAGRRAGDKAGKAFGGAFSGALKGVVAGVAALGVGRAAVGLIGDSISAASDLNETATKTEAIFGDATKAVNAFADQGAKKLGQSRLEVLDAAASFGTFGKAAKLTGPDLAKFSTGLVGLSTDLASFFNTSPEEAVQAIGAALRGESEPIRKYGVLLDDATLRNEALRLGLIKTTKTALTPQQKVLAAQSAIYKQTADAQGDFERTSDGLANKQRTLTAQVADLKGELGKGLLPIANKVVTKTSELVEGFQDGTGAGGDLRDIAEDLADGLKDVAEFSKDVFKAIDSLPGPVKKFGAELAIGLVVMSKLRTLTGPLSAGLSTMGTNFRNAETRAAGLKTGLGRLGSGLRNVSGAGGMLLLQHGLTNSNKKLGVLETSLGGFAAGFAVGGPIGAGIGTGIGLFASLKTAISGTNDVKLPTPEQLGISDIVGGLDDIIGKSTEASTALANAFLSGETKGAPPAGVAVGTTIRETARLYGIPDRTVNQALAGNVKAFKAIQAVFAKAVRDDPVLGAVDRDAVVGSLKILIDGFNKERDAKLEAIAATRDYGDSLADLPAAKRTQVEATGIVPTVAGIARVANAIEATPEEIKTLIQAAGVDATISDITSVQGKVARLDGQSATVQIGAKLSGDAVKWFGSLGWLGGKTSSSTTVANIATGADGLPRRALGGPISPGGTYWVGERGPELFTSATRGRITSANGLQSARGGSLAGQRLALVVDGRQIEGVITEIADSRVGAQRGIDSMTERAFG